MNANGLSLRQYPATVFLYRVNQVVAGPNFDVPCDVAGYNELLLIYNDLVFSAATTVGVRTSADGTTYDTGASDYQHVAIAWGAAGSSQQGSSTGVTHGAFMPQVAGWETGSGTGRPVNLDVKLRYSQDSGRDTYLESRGFHETNGGVLIMHQGVTQRNAPGLVRAVRLYANTGNINSGSCFVYGVQRP